MNTDDLYARLERLPLDLDRVKRDLADGVRVGNFVARKLVAEVERLRDELATADLVIGSMRTALDEADSAP